MSWWSAPLVGSIRACPPLHRWLTRAVTRMPDAPLPDHPLTALAHAPAFQHDLHALLPTLTRSARTVWPDRLPAPVPVLLRAELVRHWAHDASDATLARLLRTQMQVRWFVGLLLLDPTPTPAHLQQTAAWLRRDHPQVVPTLTAHLPARATRGELRLASTAADPS